MPGATPPDELAFLFADVATLAARLDKPLSCRVWPKRGARESRAKVARRVSLAPSLPNIRTRSRPLRRARARALSLRLPPGARAGDIVRFGCPFFVESAVRAIYTPASALARARPSSALLSAGLRPRSS